MKSTFFILLSALILSACNTNESKPAEKKTETTPAEFVPSIVYTITDRIPHDTNSFTEGLFVHEQNLFESTGSPDDLKQCESTFGIVDKETGKIQVKAKLDKTVYFGEGIALLNKQLFQLTYKNQIGFIYDSKTFAKIGQFTYKNTEGWGLTSDGKALIMSDGTNTLTYIDPSTFKVLKTLAVSNGGYAENLLNELEYINGYIYANVWTKNYLVKIDPSTGKVVGLLNLAPLADEVRATNPNADVLNGIAFDISTSKIYVTGKLWPTIFQLDFPI